MQGHDTDRTKFDSRDYSVTCLECGGTFEAKRSDATFCTPKCRVRWSKRPEKLNNAIDALAGFGFNCKDIASRYPSNARVEAALIELRRQIDIALANMEVS